MSGRKSTSRSTRYSHSAPIRIYRFIIPDPEKIDHIEFEPVFPSEVEWLPIGGQQGGYANKDEVEEVRLTLCALAQTSRRLWSFVLPLLWSVVHLSKVSQLGRLRETLRASPDIASHIRGFYLFWELPADYDSLLAYPEEEGALLDMAFKDRWLMWRDVARRYGCQIRQLGTGRYAFRAGCLEFVEPSKPSLMDRTASKARRKAARRECGGPDGRGKDALVKTADDFNDCVTEIVSQLSSLEAFCWYATVASMPMGVYNALAKLGNFKALHVVMSRYGGNVHARQYHAHQCNSPCPWRYMHADGTSSLQQCRSGIS